MGRLKPLASENYVQVEEGRFHHDDIGAFLYIEGYFPEGLPLVGRVHLIALSGRRTAAPIPRHP